MLTNVFQTKYWEIQHGNIQEKNLFMESHFYFIKRIYENIILKGRRSTVFY